MNKTISSRKNLKKALEDFDAWAEVRAGAARYSYGETWIRDYPDWSKIAHCFVEFLSDKSVGDWNRLDILVAKKAVGLDWMNHRLLRSIPEPELRDIVTRPYPADVIRMHMLVVARDIADPKERVSIFLNFFENDLSDAIRCEALKSLARLGWEGCESQAIQLWNANDEVSQMVALEVLGTIESSKFEEYLQQAKVSDKPGVQQASAISTIRQIQMELETP